MSHVVHVGTRLPDGESVGWTTTEEGQHIPDPPERPRIVCLCGSTRFYQTFQQANLDETMAGRIVLSVGFYLHTGVESHWRRSSLTAEQKVALDELHLRKIDLADEILVLNVGGYVGESTAREISYARRVGKPVRWLEDPS